MRPWRIRSLAFALLAVAACTGAAATSPPAGSPGPIGGPAQVVEQFMRLVSTRDYARMGALFGTREGPITGRDPAPQVERRMYAIADILQNERFVIRAQQSIPGRGPDAEQLTVQLTRQGRSVDVPFVVVRTTAGGWLVEQIDLEAVTKLQ
ncbi:MAG TPA: hypothetical protein VF771_14005 [Longimicrobiaceae bacterium]